MRGRMKKSEAWCSFTIIREVTILKPDGVTTPREQGRPATFDAIFLDKQIRANAGFISEPWNSERFLC